MSELAVVGDAFRHSAWASKTLLEACRPLTREQLTADAPGFGNILATFTHLVTSDAAYAGHLGAPRPGWAGDTSEPLELDQLGARADEAFGLWEQLLGAPFDSERILVLDDGTYEVPAGVVLAQALHHANVHREQICAALTALAQPVPDLQPWAYADATGRSRWRH